MIFQPHPYQQNCIDRIINKAANGLFLDMGLGKTVITLTAIADLRYNRFAVGRVLIIAPKKVAEATWQAEAVKWEHTQHLRIQTVLGSAQQRIRALNSPGDLWIINRENTQWLIDYYGREWPFDMVVLDESSSFKNHQAKRWKALKLVRPRIQRIVELTGTPSPKGLIDLWAQIYLLDSGERLGRTLGGYRERYFNAKPRYSRAQQFSEYAPKDDAEDAIHTAIADICVSMKAEDYLQLPACIYENIPVALSPAAQKQYKKLERELLLEHKDGVVTAQTAGVLTGKLLQLCNGAVYDTEQHILQIHDDKLEAFTELMEQLNGQHALVFYAFQHDRERLRSRLSRIPGLTVRVYREPEDEIAWNAGKIDVLLAHPASCAYGLNLQQGGHHIVWFGLTWNLEHYQQANKRLHRQGQQEPVIIHHLVTQSGVDEDVMAALAAKGETQERLMQALKARIEKARAEL
jgi:SNF2 family DNA or RNA helicase